MDGGVKGPCPPKSRIHQGNGNVDASHHIAGEVVHPVFGPVNKAHRLPHTTPLAICSVQHGTQPLTGLRCADWRREDGRNRPEQRLSGVVGLVALLDRGICIYDGAVLRGCSQSVASGLPLHWRERIEVRAKELCGDSFAIANSQVTGFADRLP